MTAHVPVPLEDAPGVRAASVRPTRAVLLAVASRLALAAVLAVAGAAAWSARLSASVGPGPQGAATAPVRVVQDDEVPGSSMAGLVDAIEAALRGTSSGLVSLEVGPQTDRWAAVRVAVDVPGRPGGIGRVLAALEAAGVTGASTEAVVAIPDGSRTDISGRVLLSDRRIARGTDPERDGQLVVTLAEDVERAGVRLRRMDVEDVATLLIRLEVDGPVAAVVPLLATIERRYGAPTRFDSVVSRRIDGDLRTVSIVFRPREGLA